MGNSEVGHLNLGAGAVVKQDITRIDDAVADGSFGENEALRKAARRGARGRRAPAPARASSRRAACTRAWTTCERSSTWPAREEVPDVVLHAFTDGRDTSPDSGAGYLAEVERLGGGCAWPRSRAATSPWTATSRWDRSAARLGRHRARPGRRPGRRLAARRRCARRTSAARPTSSSSRRSWGRRDDPATVTPSCSSTSGPTARASSPARWARTDFAEFDRGERPRVALTTLTSYQEDWDYPVAFPPARPELTLASVLAERGIAQLHVAETEKYAHVTYFFNGGEEDPYAGEERRLVDSPRDVATYDEKPEMSAEAAAAAFVERWRRRLVRLRHHQLRQPGHGRAHRRHPGGRARDRDGGRLPRPGGRGGARRAAAPAS